MLATWVKILRFFVVLPRLPFWQNLVRSIGQLIDMTVMSQKRMLKVEQEPQKLYSLSLNVQTYNNFILLQVSTFLISRYAGKALVGGGSLPTSWLTWCDLACPLPLGSAGGIHIDGAGEGSKLSLLWLSFLSALYQISSSTQRWYSFPSGHFFSTPFSATWLYPQPDTKSSWACFAVYLIICGNTFLSKPAGTLLMPTVYENWSDYSGWWLYLRIDKFALSNSEMLLTNPAFERWTLVETFLSSSAWDQLQ